MFLWISLALLIGYWVRYQFELPRTVYVACENDWPKEYFVKRKHAVARIAQWKDEDAVRATKPGYHQRVNYNIQMIRKG